MRNIKSTFVNPSLTPTENCSKQRDPSQYGNLVTTASADDLYPNCANSRKYMHSWLLFGKSDRANQHWTFPEKVLWYIMVTLPQTSSIHKHPIKKNIMTSQNDSFIKTQNHRQEQPRDTHSLTSQSSQRIQVVARTPTTKWQAQLTAHSFSHGLDLEGMSHRHPKPWIKSRCFLTTKCLAPEGKSHTHRKQSLPKPGN